MRLIRWFRRNWARIAPRRRLRVIDGDSLPSHLPRRDLVLARDGDEDWCVGMRCPCGCGRSIELWSSRKPHLVGTSGSMTKEDPVYRRRCGFRGAAAPTSG